MISNITPPTVERFGTFTESKFGISSSEDLVYIFDILRSKLYSNKIAAVVREYSTNAADANVENGLRDRPIVITAPTRMSPEFKVRDYGRGLSEDEIRNVYCMYGRSTKRSSNDYTGQLGLGSKSGFAYGDSFTIVSYKDGRKHTYTAYIDETRLGSIAKISESETTEENGIEIVIPSNISDISSFEREIIRAVKYFKVKPNVVNISSIAFQSDKNKLISGNGWAIYDEPSSYYDTKAVAIMGNIGYPINVQTLTNNNYSTNALSSPICIEFAIGELSISANREELEYNDATKKTILDRVKKIENEIAASAETSIQSCSNIIDARRAFSSYNRHLSYIIGNKIKWRGITISSSALDLNTHFCSARLYTPNGKSEVVNNIFLDKTNHRGVEEIFYHDGQRGNYAKMTHHAKTTGKHYVLIRFFDYNDPSTGQVSKPDDWLSKNHLSASLFRSASTLADPPKVVRAPRVKGQKLQNCYFMKKAGDLKGWGTQSENFEPGQCDKNGGIYIKSDHFFVSLDSGRCNAKEFWSIIQAFNKVTGESIDTSNIPVFKASDCENLGNNWTNIIHYIKDKLKSNASVMSFIQFKSVDDLWQSLGSYYGIGVFSRDFLNTLEKRSAEFTNKPDVLNVISLWQNIKKFMEIHKGKSNNNTYDKMTELSRWFPAFAEGINAENEDAAELKKELQKWKPNTRFFRWFVITTVTTIPTTKSLTTLPSSEPKGTTTMNTPSIICTDISMTVVFSGEAPKVINSDHPNFQKCREALRARDWQSLHKLVNVEESVRKYVSSNGVRVENGTLYYNNEPMNGLIVDRVFQFMRQNLPFEPLVRFIENMMANPSFRSRNELYEFLEHEGLPITEDGHFLAYKAVRSDYYDIYSGKFYNGIGTRVSMPRPKVDDDCTRGCSAGLHAGSLDYVRGYGQGDSKYLIVKINPRDVVSVPSEDSRKLRCCEYLVLSEFKEQLNNPCYSVDGSDFSWDEDCDEEDDCCGEDCCSNNPKTRGDEYDYYNY